MANELVISGLTINYTKSGARISLPLSQLSITVSATPLAQFVQSIPTADTTLTLPAAPGFCFLKNLDGTNYVQAGPDNTNWFHKLTPTIPYAMFPLNGTAIHLKANTAACDVQVLVFSL